MFPLSKLPGQFAERKAILIIAFSQVLQRCCCSITGSFIIDELLYSSSQKMTPRL